MTAAELYEIVKDVPEAAKPRDIDFNEVSESWYEYGSIDGVSDALAEAAFVGSMAVYHAARGGSLHCIDGKWKTRTPRQVGESAPDVSGMSMDTLRYRWSIPYDSPIAALAAACKEARP